MYDNFQSFRGLLRKNLSSPLRPVALIFCILPKAHLKVAVRQQLRHAIQEASRLPRRVQTAAMLFQQRGGLCVGIEGEKSIHE